VVKVFMLLFLTSPALSGFLADAREFLAGVRFARPEALWLLLLLPLLGLVNRWAARRRRAAAARIGRPAALAGQLTRPVARRRWLGLAYPLAWVLLVVGLAGPRWGKSDETGIAVGRDVVLVIDLSRTMLADDMADPANARRWQAARAGALDLLDAVARRGGHRVGVVVFAAHPKVVCHLTTDYDHVRAVLEELDGEFPPPEIRPGPTEVVSGTRIGAGLLAAVAAHDPRFPGSQDIVLISDGDDPGEDREWIRGSDAARKAGIPVHAVGVGRSDQPAVVDVGGELISTKLQGDPLKQVAAETRGQYLGAGRDTPHLGDFFRARIEPYPSREYSDDSVPLPRERYPWFLGPALVLFAVGWLRGR
jgi:Ca-activated chloride channel family protein